MKRKKILIACAMGALAISFTACKKNKEDMGINGETAVTEQSSQDIAVSDNISEDAVNAFTIAANTQGVAGARPAVNGHDESSAQPTYCFTASVSQSFPTKKIDINFGDGSVACVADGNYRKGIIHVVISDSIRKVGATAKLTFENYYVSGYKREGSITWTHSATATWTRADTGKVTAPNGRFWYHTGIVTTTQTGGFSTPYPNLADDTFSITGTRTIRNANDSVRTVTVVEGHPLRKATVCANIDKGQLRLQGPNHYAIIDFGNGDCDRLATYSIDGSSLYTYPFFLR
ncbi:MAG: hypothetical protein HY305_04555 [Sphingobacteriales bacterium]|nr:hypothetical protein [Sphingobacteriales bacterium]